MSSPRTHDCLVIGAGPAGSAAAIEMARAGLDVLVLDRGEFPRFRIGESFLPRTKRALRRLGVLDKCLALPHARKVGVEISLGDGRHGPQYFYFRDVFGSGDRETFNMARIHLDAMMMETARESGAEVRTSCAVKAIARLEDGDVQVDTEQGPVNAKWMIDASGQATAVGRERSTRRFHSFLRNVAYFEHFEKVVRPSGKGDHCFGLVIADEGWFWMIPLDATRTSVGFVAREQLHASLDVPADQRLRWAIERTPILRERMANAVGPDRNRTISDFTYRCDPFAGPGHFLIGDAAAFLDPVWSTGLTLGLLGAEQAAAGVVRIIKGASPAAERARHNAWTTRITNRAFKLVEGFYDPGFRDLLFSPRRTRGLERAFITLLAGEIDDIPFGVAARCLLLRTMCSIQRRRPIAPRVRPFKLRLAAPMESMA
ncbi:MAG: tryptophan 7-halogenase [Planctomycetes bacterium]|nr:tryptophan 7-halogenase [Planctomycetota bacterium]